MSRICRVICKLTIRDKTYRLPLLVGDGDGSGLVYAVAAQAPENILAGVVTDGLCPVVVPTHAVCGAGVAGDQHLKPAPVAAPLLVMTVSSAHCPVQLTSEFVRKVALGREIRLAVVLICPAYGQCYAC